MKRFATALGWAAIALIFGIILCMAWFICQAPDIPKQRTGAVEGQERLKIRREMKKHGVLVIREDWEGRQWITRKGKKVRI
jgi:hypothetical protein